MDPLRFWKRLGGTFEASTNMRKGWVSDSSIDRMKDMEVLLVSNVDFCLLGKGMSRENGERREKTKKHTPFGTHPTIGRRGGRGTRRSGTEVGKCWSHGFRVAMSYRLILLFGVGSGDSVRHVVVVGVPRGGVRPGGVDGDGTSVLLFCMETRRIRA